MNNNCYNSEIEFKILNANQGEPACLDNQNDSNELHTVNNVTGKLLNKSEQDTFSGPISIENYPIHHQSTAQIINKQTNCIEYTRNLSIKYLSPGHIKLPGAIIINQEQNVKLPQAPPVIMRQYPQIPCNIHDEPDTLVLREQPPVYPQVPQTKIINLPGQLLLPGPDRKVIIERLPELPDSPQNIQIERWLPYKDKPRKVILNPKPCDPHNCCSQLNNLIIIWEKRDCTQINDEIKTPIIELTNPDKYRDIYGSSLLEAWQLPEIAQQLPDKHGKQMAASFDQTQFYQSLEGDVHALKLLGDLDSIGLGAYKNYV